MKENKIFPWLVAIAAASISFSAAFYSIFGIGKMFAGAATNVMIMAASLEFAKLVIASFLYRFWDDVNKGLRAYLSIACVVLIMITSAGIYGFLSSAYQETANKVENSDKGTLVVTKQKEMIQKQLDQAEKQLELKSNRQNTLSDMRSRQQANADNLIASNKSASSVRTQMNQLGKESSQLDADIKVLQDTIASKTQQISLLENQILDKSTNNDLANEIGPLKYIAKLTGKTLDQVVNWFIIALMIVFDPLAIALVVAANFVFSYISDKKKEVDEFEIWRTEKEEAKRLAEEEERKRLEEEEKKRHEDEEAARIKAEEEEAARLAEEEEKKRLEEEESARIAELEEIARINSELEEEFFMVGNTPLADYEEEIIYSPEIIDEEIIYSPEIPVDAEIIYSPEITEDDVIYSPELNDVEEEIESEENQTEENASEEIFEEGYVDEEGNPVNNEDGEFAGYKLGNVYKKRPESLKEADPKNVPLDLLVTKGDPTRL